MGDIYPSTAHSHIQVHRTQTASCVAWVNIFIFVLYKVIFSEESLPKGTGEYLLGYYSNNMSTLIGVTEPFQVGLTFFTLDGIVCSQ